MRGSQGAAAATAAADEAVAVAGLLRGVLLQHKQESFAVAAASTRLQRLQRWCLLLQNRGTSNVALPCCVNRGSRDSEFINEANSMAAAAGASATTPSAAATPQKLELPTTGERSLYNILQATGASGGEADVGRRQRGRKVDVGCEQRLLLVEQKSKADDLFEQQPRQRQQQQRQEQRQRRHGRCSSFFCPLSPPKDPVPRVVKDIGDFFVWTHVQQLTCVCPACRIARLRGQGHQLQQQGPERQQLESTGTSHEGVSRRRRGSLAAGGWRQLSQQCSHESVQSAAASTLAARLPATAAAAVAAWPPRAPVAHLLSSRAVTTAATSSVAAGAARELSVAPSGAGSEGCAEPITECSEARLQRKPRNEQNSPTEAAARSDLSGDPATGSGGLQGDSTCRRSTCDSPFHTDNSCDGSSSGSGKNGDTRSSNDGSGNLCSGRNGSKNSSDDADSKADSSSSLFRSNICGKTSISGNTESSAGNGSSVPCGSNHSKCPRGSSGTNLESSCSTSSNRPSTATSSSTLSSGSSGQKPGSDSEVLSARSEREEDCRRTRWHLRRILFAAVGGGFFAAYGYLLVQCDFNVAKTEWLVGEKLRSFLLQHTRDERRDAGDRSKYQVGLPDALKKEVAKYFLQLDLDKPNGVRRSDALALAQQLGFATNTSEACKAFIEAGSGRTADVKRRSGSTLQEFAELFERLLQELELPAACAAGLACDETAAGHAEERPAAAISEERAATGGFARSLAGVHEQQRGSAAGDRVKRTADDDTSGCQRDTVAVHPHARSAAATCAAATARETGAGSLSQKTEDSRSTGVLHASPSTDGRDDLQPEQESLRQQAAAASGKSRRTLMEERMLKFFADSNQNTVMPGTAPPCYSEERFSVPLARSMGLEVSSSSSRVLQQQHPVLQQQQQQRETAPPVPSCEEKQAVLLEIQRTERFLSAYCALQNRRELSDAEILRLKDLQHTLKSLKHELWSMEHKQ